MRSDNVRNKRLFIYSFVKCCVSVGVFVDLLPKWFLCLFFPSSFFVAFVDLFFLSAGNQKMQFITSIVDQERLLEGLTLFFSLSFLLLLLLRDVRLFVIIAVLFCFVYLFCFCGIRVTKKLILILCICYD